MEDKDLLQIVATACDDKRAEDIIALDMNEVSLVADYFLICHGSNERQVQAIARGIKDAVEEEGISIKRLEGMEQARWVLVDLGGIVCHIFHKEERSYYNLERLWGDATQVTLHVGQEK
ncbi:ribosome silencing factor [Virgibacillus halodenitrificans]|jgi:ribosome-associated protein|uniref:Ribosomal silencing factor RsfS n=1 Tax=Virgibacillus halodenitrificans TaxID=1482 RepID=A0AAC9NK54_VIRHA|nr:ribosome silencing factor [Virgibacillus halodenitrificans]APC48202.1 ribosome silencing factor [Virgibacillus halodenitrificans]MCG1029989.1 ribosome silencing factor [Virgibacillus halodenitrificans]MCJ0930799.1 ribosome silencing factor [Virgibacillus halodenitrificans]MEC2160031.1 ribosome silencing factor [Virgibacillus halodenitrificans]MYL46643.1 ribosome silencing factor [Virgibacillus halodenitrificans]